MTRTMFRCAPRPGDTHPDEWILVGLVDDGSEQREEMERLDASERKRCDVCQCEVERAEELTMSGGDALCDECARGEGLI